MVAVQNNGQVVGAAALTRRNRSMRGPAAPPGVERPLSEDLLAVVDSGSPISVADAALFRWLDVAVDEPLYEVPLGLGSGFGAVQVYEVELTLRPSPGIPDDPVAWRLHLAARANWRLPFAVVLDQRG